MSSYCQLPFTQFDVQGQVQFPCCGAWCNYYTIHSSSIKEAWNSEKMQEFRRAILDGTYQYCSDICPLKGMYVKGVGKVKVAPKQLYTDQSLLPELETIKVCSDYTCNLTCKTCRDRRIVTDPQIVWKQLQQIEQEFGKTIRVIELLGCGDPIASRPVFKWLQDFNPDRFPKLESIRLDTNMQLLTEKVWQKLEVVRPYLNHFNISIDAATKETYEKIRRGGRWETLIENCRYLQKHVDVREYHISFCVCKDNLHEIEDFYKLCLELFPKNLTQILYQEVLWFPERVSKENFDNIAIKDELDIQVIKQQIERIKHDKIVRVQADQF